MTLAEKSVRASALLIGASLLALAACSPAGKDAGKDDSKPASSAAATAADLPAANPENNAYFGVVHVHTGWSFDGMTNCSKTTPMDAYAWAQGKAITGSGGPELKISTPLDFYMVSDHTEMIGVFNQMADPTTALGKTELAKRVTSPDTNTRMQAFAGVLRDMSTGKLDPMLTDTGLARTVWADIVKAADANYVPGKFTTFAGFGWTSNPNKMNSHRVVVPIRVPNGEWQLCLCDQPKPDSLQPAPKSPAEDAPCRSHVISRGRPARLENDHGTYALRTNF